MNYGTLNNLNTILTNLRKDAITIGFTIAALMLVIYAISLMFDHDTTPAGQNRRWENLRKVLIGAGIIAGAGALITFSRQLGGGL